MTDNKLKKTAPVKVELNEIATRGKDVFNKPWGGVIQPKDTTLASRGQSEGIWIYDNLERDTAVFSAMQKRKSAVTSRNWTVVSASDDALDVRAADVVRRALSNIAFDHACHQLLDAILKGFAVTEIMWDNSEGETIITDLIPRDQRRFTFAEDGSLRLLTEENRTTGIELPDRKFIVHSVGSKDGNPFGLGLGTRLFWPVLFKRNGMEFWLTFADKYGTPTAIGKYPAGTPQSEQQNLLSSMARIAQDSAFVIPETFIVELLDAARSGSGADTYEKLLRYCDEMISEAVLGEASSQREYGGALAAASIIRNEVRLELSRNDSDLLSSTLNNTLIQWLVDFNTPGARPPKVWRYFTEKKDLKATAETDQILFSLGWKRTDESLAELYGDGFLPINNPAAPAGEKPSPSPAPTPSSEFSAQEDDDAAQAALDALLDNLPAAALNAQSRQMLKPVVDAIMAADSYEAAFAALDRVMPSVETTALETALGNAMFVAETYGRLTAENA